MKRRSFPRLVAGKTAEPSCSAKTKIALAVAAALLPLTAQAAPKGGQFTHGTGNISQSGRNTTITASNKSIIQYSGFDIGKNESVKFIQPGKNSTVLNRVLSSDPTQIFGRLESNGKITLVNSAGIYFQNGSVINVGGIYAASGNLSNADFLGSKNTFTDLSGSVVNSGSIRSSGTVALVGNSVANQGYINAGSNTVVMAAGDNVLIGERQSNIYVQTSTKPAAGASAVAPKKLLASGDLYSLAVVNSGAIKSGNITLQSTGGKVQAGGKLDASNQNGRGGKIKLLGKEVELRGAEMTASGRTGGGEILIGGDFQGKGDSATAKNTTVDAATVISADAIREGNGGKIIVWSDDTTDFQGSISAKGRGNGNGGFVEISGKQHLRIGGLADVRAEQGRAGTVLWDPGSVTIQDGPNSGPGIDQDVFNDAFINAQLGLGSLIISTAASSNGATENLTLNADASLSWSANTLTLTAGNNITLNGIINATNTGQLNLIAATGIFLNGSISVSGGTANTPALSLSASNDTFVVTGANAGMVGSLAFTGLTSVNALGGVGDILDNNSGSTFLGATNAVAGIAVSNFETVDTAALSLTSGNDTFAVTGSNAGTFGSLAFTGLTSVDALGGIGDVLDNNSGLTFLGATNAVAGIAVANFEAVDTAALSLTAGNDTFAVTGSNAGTFGSLAFTGLTSVDALGGIGDVLDNNSGLTFLGATNAVAGIAVANFEAVDTAALSLTAGNDTFAVTGSNAGTFGSLAFTGLTSVDGLGGNNAVILTSGNDVFAVTAPRTGSGSEINFTNLDSVDARAGSDTLQAASGLNFSVANRRVGGVTVSDFEHVSIGPGGSLSLTDDDDLFEVTGNQTGTFLGVNYSGLQSVDGLAGTDTIQLNPPNAVIVASGVQAATTFGIDFTNIEIINAVTDGLNSLTLTSASDVFSFNGSQAGSALGITYTNLNSLAGGGGSDSLVGTSGADQWDITGVNSGEIEGVEFTAFSQLRTGGTATDTFNFTNGTSNVNGLISGTNANGGNLADIVFNNTGFTTNVTGRVIAMGLRLEGGSFGIVNTGNSAVTLAANLVGSLNFFNATSYTIGTVDGINGITTSGGAITLDAVAGRKITVEQDVSTGSETIGDIVFNQDVILATQAITVTGGSIAFVGKLDGTLGLTLTTDGLTDFNDLVGGAVPLASVTTDEGGTTEIQADVKTTGFQTYNDEVTLAGDSTLTGTSLTLSSAGLIGAGNNLTLDFSEAFTVPGGITGVKNFTSAKAINTDGTFITSGTQTYQGAVAVTGDTVLISTGVGAAANIVFNSTVDSFDTTLHSLTVNTVGSTQFDAFVGAENPLLSLITDAGGRTVFKISGGTQSVLTSTFQTYGDAVALGQNTILASTGNGAISFNGTVDSLAGTALRALTINTGGATVFGNGGLDLVGGSNALLSLVTDDGAAADGLTGERTVFNIVGGGQSVRTSGLQTYGDAVALGQNTILASTRNGAISFNGTVDSVADTALRALTINTGGATFFGNGGLDLVGGSNALLSLVTDDGAAADGLTGERTVFNIVGGGQSVRTSGLQTYGDAVALGQNTILASTGNGAISFSGTVDSLAGSALRALTVNTGGATFFGNGGLDLVGGSNALLSLVTDDAAAVNGLTGERTVFNILGGGQSVRTSGLQTYGDAVALGQNTILASTDNGAISFNGTVDSLAGTALRTLTVNTGGATFFGNGGLDLVGGSNALLSLVTDDAAAANGLAGERTVFNIAGGGQSVRTSTFQTYEDAVVVGQNTILASTGNGTISFNGTVDSLAGTALRTLTINTGGATFFGNGGLDLVGGSNALLSLVTDDAAAANGLAGERTVFNILSGAQSVRTSGLQTYGDAVALGQNTILASTGNGAISFNGTVDSLAGTALRTLTVNTGGATFFGNGGLDLVGGSNALLSLVTDDAAAANGLAGERTVFNIAGGGQSVRTSTFQTYEDAVVLGQNTILASMGNGAISFNGTVDSLAGTALRTLTVNTGGATFFGNGGLDLVGGSNALLSLVTDDAAAANGLAGERTVFNILSGAQSVRTSGLQTYGDAVALGQNTILASTGNGAISFNGTVDSLAGTALRTLTVNTGGATFFGNGGLDLVGGSNALLSLVTDDAAAANGLAGERTVFNIAGGGQSVRTSTFQTYEDAVVLGQNTILASTGNGAISFNGTVDSLAGTALRALTINTGGATFFGNGGLDLVGGSNALLSVVTDDAAAANGLAGERTVFNILGGGQSVRTSGLQTYGDAVALGQNTILASTGNGAISFNGTVDSLAGTALRTLTVNTGGATFFGNGGLDLVGGSNALLSLVTDDAAAANGLAGERTVFNILGGGQSVRTSGLQTYGDAVALGQNTILASTGSGAISFNGTVDSLAGTALRALTINTGGTTFFGNGGLDLVGGSNALLSLITDDAAAADGPTGERTVFNIVGGGQSVRTSGLQTYGEAVALGQNTILASTGNGAISFNGAVDSLAGTALRALTVNTGGATFFGNGGLDLVGGSNALLSLVTDDAAAANGLAGERTVFNIAGGGQSVRTSTFQTYEDAVVLGQNTILASTGNGAISFNGTVDSLAGTALRALTINTGGATFFGNGGLDLVGGSNALLSLVTDDGAAADGLTGERTVFNIVGGGQSVRTSGLQTYGDAVALGQNTILASTGNGAISFSGTVDSLAGSALRALTVNTGGATFFGNGGLDLVGGSNALLSLVTDDAAAANGLAGERTVFNIVGGGQSVRTSGLQTYGDAVALGQNTILASTGNGAISFNGAVDSLAGSALRALTINTGGATFFGNGGLDLVGGSNALLSLVTDDAAAANGLTGERTVFNIVGGGQSVRTSGLQTYGDAVALGQNTILASTGNGAISFSGAVDSLAGTALRALTVNTGGATFFGNGGLDLVGGSNALLSLITDDAAAANGLTGERTVFNIVGGGQSVRTSGLQTYGDAVALGQNTILASTGNGAISFNATVDSLAGSALRALTVKTGGVTSLKLDVGAIFALQALTTDSNGQTIVGNFDANVITINALEQTYADPLLLADNAILRGSGSGGDFGALSITIGSVTNDPSISFRNLTISARTGTLDIGPVFANSTREQTAEVTIGSAGTIGSPLGVFVVNARNAPPGSLGIEPPGPARIILRGDRTTGGDMTFEGDVFLANDIQLASTGGGNIEFDGAVNSLTLPRSLDVNTTGDEVFGDGFGDDRVGGQLALSSLETDADTDIGTGGRTIFDILSNPAAPSVTTTGIQIYNDAVSLEANTILASTDASGDITFNQTINGAFAFEVNSFGDQIFNDLIGNSEALSSLTTDASNMGGKTQFNKAALSDVPAVITTGFQTYGDAVSISQDAMLVSFVNGDIRFNASVDGTVPGAQSLVVSTGGRTTFAAEVGGSIALASLRTDSLGSTEVNGGLVQTSGEQDYQDIVSVGNSLTDFTSTGLGAITFHQTLDGNSVTTVTTGGQTTFTGRVGGSIALNSLTTDQLGSTNILGGLVRTNESQTYLDMVTVEDSATTQFKSDGNSGINFAQTLDGISAVTVTTSGQTTFSANVGASIPLASLVTNGGGSTVINGALINTTGLQRFVDATNLATTALTFFSDGSPITFENTLDGASATTITTGGLTTFNGAVGANSPLASLLINGEGVISVSGGQVRTQSFQKYEDSVQIKNDTTFSGRDISIVKALSGSYDATFNASGNTTLSGEIEIDSLATDAAGTTILDNVNLSSEGEQEYGDAVRVRGRSSLESLNEDKTPESGVRFLDSVQGDELEIEALNTNISYLNEVDLDSLTASSDSSVFNDDVQGGDYELTTGSGNLEFLAPITVSNLTADAAGASASIVMTDAFTSGDLNVSAGKFIHLTGTAYTTGGSFLLNGTNPVNPQTPFSTIIADAGDVSIIANGDFTMALHQRFFVTNGSLSIEAETATLGDTAASQDLTVEASNVLLLGREKLVTSDAAADAGDLGLSFVARSIRFSAILDYADNSELQVANFAVASGQPAVPKTVQGISLFEDSNIEQQLDVGTFNVFGDFSTVQPQAGGVSQAEIAETIAGALPRSREEKPIVDDNISQDDLSKLGELGVYPRFYDRGQDLSVEKIFLYYQRDAFQNPNVPSNYKVVTRRLQRDLVTAVLAQSSKVEEALKLCQPAVETIRAQFMTTDAFTSPEAFLPYLETQLDTEDGKLVKVALNEMKKLYDKLPLLNLTNKEIDLAKNVIAKRFPPLDLQSEADIALKRLLIENKQPERATPVEQNTGQPPKSPEMAAL